MWQATRHTDSYRVESEDRAELVWIGPDTLTCIVADGVGGRAGGGEAADLAVRLAREGITASGFRATDPYHYNQLLSEIDRALADDPDAGETTLVVATLTSRSIIGASVGDSEAWWIDSGGHFDLTGGQERKPYLGSGAALAVPFALPAPRAGMLLVATDGLFKYASADEITGRIAAGEAEEVDTLAAAVADLARTSRRVLLDDLAVVLCRREASEGGVLTRLGLGGRLRRWINRSSGG